jgi:hypothetical protein
MAKPISSTDEDQPPVPGVGGSSHQDIATAAYYIAERRGFEGDLQLEDWLEAERALDARQEDGPTRDALAGRAHVEEDIKPDEVHSWADRLKVSAAKLRAAIQRVGANSTKVKISSNITDNKPLPLNIAPQVEQPSAV